MGAKPKDITNKKYGKLTAKYRTDKKDGNCYIWHCECECGGAIDVSIAKLEHEEIQSCGCLRHEYIDITNKIYTRLKVISYAGNKNGKSMWNCECECGGKSVVSYGDLESGKCTSCGCLRVEQMQNMYTGSTNVHKILSKKIRSTNTSGVTGVSWSKSRGKWEAEISFCGKRYRLGRHDKKEDAISARKKAEKELHSSFLEWYAKEYPDRWKKLNKSNKAQVTND